MPTNIEKIVDNALNGLKKVSKYTLMPASYMVSHYFDLALVVTGGLAISDFNSEIFGEMRVSNAIICTTLGLLGGSLFDLNTNDFNGGRHVRNSYALVTAIFYKADILPYVTGAIALLCDICRDRKSTIVFFEEPGSTGYTVDKNTDQ